MLKQKRRFNRSQAAHQRLSKKHYDIASRTTDARVHERSLQLGAYHSFCFSIQQDIGRILNSKEKRKTMNRVGEYFYQ